MCSSKKQVVTTAPARILFPLERDCSCRRRSIELTWRHVVSLLTEMGNLCWNGYSQMDQAVDSSRQQIDEKKLVKSIPWRLWPLEARQEMLSFCVLLSKNDNFRNINVSTRIVWWCPIVASFCFLIEYLGVWGGASSVKSFFSDVFNLFKLFSILFHFSKILFFCFSCFSCFFSDPILSFFPNN